MSHDIDELTISELSLNATTHEQWEADAAAAKEDQTPVGTEAALFGNPKP